jgi:hypothetical protein
VTTCPVALMCVRHTSGIMAGLFLESRFINYLNSAQKCDF